MNQSAANPSPPVIPCLPLFFLKTGAFSPVKMLPDFVIFHRLGALLFRYGNSDHSSTYQGCFWAFEGSCLNNRGTDPKPTVAPS